MVGLGSASPLAMTRDGEGESEPRGDDGLDVGRGGTGRLDGMAGRSRIASTDMEEPEGRSGSVELMMRRKKGASGRPKGISGEDPRDRCAAVL